MRHKTKTVNPCASYLKKCKYYGWDKNNIISKFLLGYEKDPQTVNRDKNYTRKNKPTDYYLKTLA